MAMRSRHYFVALVVSCAGVAVAYLPPRPPTLRSARDIYLAEWSIARELGRAVGMEIEALALLERRDSALPRLESLAGEIRLYIDPALPENLDSAIRRIAGDAKPFEGLAPDVTVAAAIFLDTITEWEGIRVQPPARTARTRHLLPRATDGATCLSVSTIGPDIRNRWANPDPEERLRVPYTRATLVGVCDYVAAFGVPSPSVERWILSGAIEPDAVLPTRCLQGQDRACELLVFRPSGSVLPEYGPGRFSILGGSLQGNLVRFNQWDSGFLGFVIDSVGPAAFGRVWRDSGAVAVAFERELQKPIAVAMREWLQSRRGDPADAPTTLVAPGVVVQILLATIIGATVAVAVATLRQARA